MLIKLTNKWTGSVIIYPVLLDPDEPINIPYSSKNWIITPILLT